MPRKDGLMVVSGGSGHAIKFLPVLGRGVVEFVRGKDDGAYGEVGMEEGG